MWIGWGVGNVTITASTDALTASLNAAALLLRPFTILRTHVDILVESDQAATSELFIATYGMIVVTDTASAVGVTAVPDPSGIAGDANASWFTWADLTTRFQFLSSVGFHPDAGRHVSIDSKGMRKVGSDDDIVTVVSNDSAVGGLVTDNGRMLIQLH